MADRSRLRRNLRPLRLLLGGALVVSISCGRTSAPEAVPRSEPEAPSGETLPATTELHRAARDADLDRILELVEAGGDLDTLDSCGRTPLDVLPLGHHLNRIAESAQRANEVLRVRGARTGYEVSPRLPEAAWRGDLELVGKLLEEGQDVDRPDCYGATPLHRAALGGHAEILEELLDAGAEVDARDRHRQTALHYTHHVEVVELLLARGASTEVRNRDDRTPLHHAAALDHPHAIPLLLAAGASLDPLDGHGETPLDRCVEGSEVWSQLRERGARLSAELSGDR